MNDTAHDRPGRPPERHNSRFCAVRAPEGGRPELASAPVMETTVEPQEGNKVKLSVAIAETEFEPAIDAAFRKIAQEVRLPGFRPGKVPRKILEQRIGTEAARQHLGHRDIRTTSAHYVSKKKRIEVMIGAETAGELRVAK